MKRINPKRRSTPPGFTLLELIIVIGLIALLAGISFAVYGNMMANAREAATETTIAKINGLLRDQVNAFYRQLDPRSRETQTLAGKFRSSPFNLTSDRETSIVLATKASFLRAYPQNLYETAGFDRSVGTADDIPLFVGWLADHNPAVPANASNISEADSSELLFLAMTEGKVRGATPVGRSAFNASELGDTDGDGWTELIDAWGQPLRYYRWPTRLVNPLGYRAGRLNTNMTLTGTTLQYDRGPGMPDFPDPANVEYYVVVGTEQMRVIPPQSAGTLNVVRGQRSTEAATHTPGDRVKLAPFTEMATLLLGFVNSDVLASDADDKFGAVAELLPNGAAAHLTDITGTAFTPGLATADYELLFHTLDSYHAPLIVSAGEDGKLGLIEPGPISLTGALPDASDLRNPQNIWIPGSSTVLDQWQWGTLAQPDTKGGDPATLSTLFTNPGDSDLGLADNITNYNGSN